MNGPKPLGLFDSCCQVHDACASRIDRGPTLSPHDNSAAKCKQCDTPLRNCIFSSYRPGANSDLPFSVFLISPPFVAVAPYLRDCTFGPPASAPGLGGNTRPCK
jgi:hypothetical protein